MARNRSQMPNRKPRYLVPWLVKERDFRRHVGRAIAACKKGRVIYAVLTVNGIKSLVSLVRPDGQRSLLLAAKADLARGRFCKVSLKNCPDE